MYTAKDTLRLAKRYNNTKRSYLLVNPLQAKHIPVSPTESLSMMNELGKKLSDKYPKTKLVIGFAETATAIGAAVAECFSPNCVYVHTTRESVPRVIEWVYSAEEHSHATEQKLVGDYLGDWISATDSVIFVDDEITTGKTLINLIDQLRAKYPQLNKKQIIAASILNRVSAANEQRLANANIVCEWLVKVPEEDYSAEVQNIPIRSAATVEPVVLDMAYQALFCGNFHDPRTGTNIGKYKHSCDEVAETFLVQFTHKIERESSILVLGTEECMYPALKVGEVLERMGQNYKVRCHATTRSPIGISDNSGYPITSGHKIKSFYEDGRETYIYNLTKYDVVIVVTDTALNGFEALENLAGAFCDDKPSQLFYIQNGKNVWYTRGR